MQNTAIKPTERPGYTSPEKGNTPTEKLPME